MIIKISSVWKYWILTSNTSIFENPINQNFKYIIIKELTNHSVGTYL